MISGEGAHLRTAKYRSVAPARCVRCLLPLLLGTAGVIWAFVSLPAFWAAVPPSDVTARVLGGDRFKPGFLSKALARMRATRAPILSRSHMARAEALIVLWIAEEETDRKSPEEEAGKTIVAEEALKVSLSYNPADSCLWVILYSMNLVHKGFDEEAVRFLEQSYATGPLEGWIALRRNIVALAAFSSLSQSLQDVVVTEFAGLVRSNFIEEAALNLVGVGWPHRDRMLARLAGIDIIPRERFAKRLAREGLRVAVPGVVLDERSWRR